MAELLLCFHRCIRRIFLQPAHIGIPALEPHGVPGRNRDQVLAGTTEDYPKCPLQRTEGPLPGEKIPGSDHDRYWCNELECLPTGG